MTLVFFIVVPGRSKRLAIVLFLVPDFVERVRCSAESFVQVVVYAVSFGSLPLSPSLRRM